MVVPIEELSRFIKEAMFAVSTVQEHAEQMTDVLVTADCRAHYSHGLNQLGEWLLMRAFYDIYLLLLVGSYRHS
jgi:LDH2 family malate/lactate/ureidoglycolate dehydrogenase